MQAHELFLEEPLLLGVPPRYEKERGYPAYIITDGGKSVSRVVVPSFVIVPLIERGNHMLPDLAMAMIEAALLDKTCLQADSLENAILLGKNALEDLLDLNLGSILVRTGTEINKTFGAQVAYHDDVEPNLIICLPSPEYIGRIPIRWDVFGMILFNPSAIVPVRIIAK